ncbi:MAG: hypothetical protein ACREHD_23965, partial [Pirellulales bacterium]
TVTAVDNAPVVNLVSGSISTPEIVTVGDKTPAVNLGATVSDVDAKESLTPNEQITITYPTAAGTLYYNTGLPVNQANSPGLTVTSSTAGGTTTLVMSGSIDTLNSDLGNIGFAAAQEAAATFTSPIDVTLQANDLGNYGLGGPLNSVQQTLTITITPTHHAPLINTATVSLPNILENLPAEPIVPPPATTPGTNNAPAGSGVGGLMTNAATFNMSLDGDPSFTLNDGMAITAADETNGQWEYYNGTTWTAFENGGPALSTTHALLLPAGYQVAFHPNPGFVGTSTFSFHGWDGYTDATYTGTAGGYGDTSTVGLTSPYSVNSGTIKEQVLLVNQPPYYVLQASTSTLENNTNPASGGSPTGENPNVIVVQN